MRLCIFTADLGTIARRQEALLREATAFTGQVFTETAFVGLRQSGPLPESTVGFQPFVEPENYARTRIANAVLYLADATLAPRWTPRAALARCASAIVEAILACGEHLPGA